jgi:hypothetical protein
MASGSQASTIKAMSHLIARSLSVSAPINSATWRIGAASVSSWRPLAPSAARSALRSARVEASRCRSPARARRALRWPSMAERAALVRPRLAASSTAWSIWPSRRSRSATAWLVSSRHLGQFPTSLFGSGSLHPSNQSGRAIPDRIYLPVVGGLRVWLA